MFTYSLFDLPKVYTLSVAGDRLIVGTAGRRVLVWDLRNMGYVQQRRESSLKYQTRCIRAFPNKQVNLIVYLFLKMIRNSVIIINVVNALLELVIYIFLFLLIVPKRVQLGFLWILLLTYIHE